MIIPHQACHQPSPSARQPTSSHSPPIDTAPSSPTTGAPTMAVGVPCLCLYQSHRIQDVLKYTTSPRFRPPHPLDPPPHRPHPLPHHSLLPEPASPDNPPHHHSHPTDTRSRPLQRHRHQIRAPDVHSTDLDPPSRRQQPRAKGEGRGLCYAEQPRRGDRLVLRH